MLHGKQNKQETKKLLQKLPLQKLPSHISKFKVLPETFQATYQQLSHKPSEKSDYSSSHCYIYNQNKKMSTKSSKLNVFGIVFLIKWILENVKELGIISPYLSAILILYFEKYYYSQIAKSSGIGMATKFSLATASFCGISVQTQFLLEQLNL